MTSIDQPDKHGIRVVARRILVFVLVAMVLLTPLDLLHVVFGVRTAESDLYLTPLKFGLVGGVLGFLSFIIDPQPHRAKTSSTIFYGCCFASGYAATAMLSSNSLLVLLLAGLCLAQSFYMIKVSSSIKVLIETVPFALLLGTAGPLVEYIDVRLGGFNYRGTDGIPIWLPFLWTSGAFLLRALVGSTRGKAHVIAWLLTAVEPFAKFVVAMYNITVMSRERGLRRAWSTVMRQYGWKK